MINNRWIIVIVMSKDVTRKNPKPPKFGTKILWIQLVVLNWWMHHGHQTHRTSIVGTEPASGAPNQPKQHRKHRISIVDTNLASGAPNQLNGWTSIVSTEPTLLAPNQHRGHQTSQTSIVDTEPASRAPNQQNQHRQHQTSIVGTEPWFFDVVNFFVVLIFTSFRLHS